jgi:hypothetical protein
LEDPASFGKTPLVDLLVIGIVSHLNTRWKTRHVDLAPVGPLVEEETA